ncbi:hypothetical protein AKG09_11260 [Neisseria sp. 83E34]|nr:hypothetical protein AKG09_11260 [Neisseria sp. 83E34]
MLAYPLRYLKKYNNFRIITIFSKKQIVLYVKWINLLYGILSAIGLKFKPRLEIIFSSKIDQGSVRIILIISAIQGFIRNSIKIVTKYRNDIIIYLFNFIYYL